MADYDNIELLVSAVRDQIGADTEEEFKEILHDVNTGSAEGGFPGFIYNGDTCKFARENMDIIFNHIKELASDLGEDPLTLISNFNCLSELNIPPFEIASVIYNQPDEATINDGVDTQVLNALAWVALEEVADYYILQA